MKPALATASAPITGWLCLLALASCQFSPELPPNLNIACSSTSNPCPTGYVCRPALGRCIDTSLLQDPPAGATSFVLTPDLGNGQTTFTLTFEVTGALAQPPNAFASVVHHQGTVTTYPFACNLCSPSVPCVCTFTPDPQDLPPEGSLEVQVEIVDALGNTPPPFAAPSFQLDLTPPSVVPPASLNLTSPPSVTTQVQELGPGVTAELCFRVDEALGSVPPVWAFSTAEPDAGTLTFTIAENYPIELSYCYRAQMPVLRTFPDGPLEVWTVITDLAGNQARVPIAVDSLDGGAELTVDYTPPPAPDLSADSWGCTTIARRGESCPPSALRRSAHRHGFPHRRGGDSGGLCRRGSGD